MTNCVSRNIIDHRVSVIGRLFVLMLLDVFCFVVFKRV